MNYAELANLPIKLFVIDKVNLNQILSVHVVIIIILHIIIVVFVVHIALHSMVWCGGHGFIVNDHLPNIIIIIIIIARQY